MYSGGRVTDYLIKTLSRKAGETLFHFRQPVGNCRSVHMRLASFMSSWPPLMAVQCSHPYVYFPGPLCKHLRCARAVRQAGLCWRAMNPQPFLLLTFIICPPSQCSYLYEFRRIIIKNSYRKLKTSFICSGKCLVGRFFESRDGSGVIPDVRGKNTQCSPHLAKTNMKIWKLYVLHIMNLKLPGDTGWGSISMYPSCYIYIHIYIYISILLSLSLSLSVYTCPKIWNIIKMIQSFIQLKT